MSANNVIVLPMDAVNQYLDEQNNARRVTFDRICGILGFCGSCRPYMTVTSLVQRHAALFGPLPFDRLGFANIGALVASAIRQGKLEKRLGATHHDEVRLTVTQQGEMVRAGTLVQWPAVVAARHRSVPGSASTPRQLVMPCAATATSSSRQASLPPPLDRHLPTSTTTPRGRAASPRLAATRKRPASRSPARDRRRSPTPPIPPRRGFYIASRPRHLPSHARAIPRPPARRRYTPSPPIVYRRAPTPPTPISAPEPSLSYAEFRRRSDSRRHTLLDLRRSVLGVLNSQARQRDLSVSLHASLLSALSHTDDALFALDDIRDGAAHRQLDLALEVALGLLPASPASSPRRGSRL